MFVCQICLLTEKVIYISKIITSPTENICFFPSLSPTGKQVNAFQQLKIYYIQKNVVSTYLKLLKICNGKRKIYSENQVCPARSQCVQSSIWGARTTTSWWTTFKQTILTFMLNCVSHNSKHYHSQKRKALNGSVLSQHLRKSNSASVSLLNVSFKFRPKGRCKEESFVFGHCPNQLTEHQGSSKKKWYFVGIFLKKGGRKFWWPLFLALKPRLFGQKSHFYSYVYRGGI